jgi:hypothetical protein
MTWCSENSTPLGLRLASSAIHRRFVDRFVGFSVLSPCFPSMALSSRRLPSLLRVPASPVPRSRRYYEGATTSHPRVHGRLLVRFHCPRVPPCSCPPQRSGKVGGPFQARALLRRLPIFQLALRGREWDLSGLQAVLPVPLLRSTTPVESKCPCLVGHLDAAPAEWTAKASAMFDFGANPQLRHMLPYASRVTLPHTCKACFRLAGSAFAGRASNPLDRCERFRTAAGRSPFLLS